MIDLATVAPGTQLIPVNATLVTGSLSANVPSSMYNNTSSNNNQSQPQLLAISLGLTPSLITVDTIALQTSNQFVAPAFTNSDQSAVNLSENEWLFAAAPAGRKFIDAHRFDFPYSFKSTPLFSLTQS